MATTALSSSFPTSMQVIKSVHSRNWPNYHALKIACPKSLRFAPISHSVGLDPDPIGNRWRFNLRITAAVAEEEAAAAALTSPAEEEAAAAEVPNTKLYFGNLPYNCDSSQLAGIIQEHASPELIEVLYDRNTGKSRGFAFVTMSSIEECNAVIQNLDGSEFGGRILRVNFSDKPKPKEPLYPETEHKLFIGNLSWSVTSEILTEAFQKFGNIVGARVLYDGETGRSRGYGFVSYETKEDMDNALQALNGVEIEGRAMRVSLADGKKQ